MISSGVNKFLDLMFTNALSNRTLLRRFEIYYLSEIASVYAPRVSRYHLPHSSSHARHRPSHCIKNEFFSPPLPHPHSGKKKNTKRHSRVEITYRSHTFARANCPHCDVTKYFIPCRWHGVNKPRRLSDYARASEAPARL